MKQLTMLCGVPGSGKSTFVDNYCARYCEDSKYMILSTDDIIQDIADRHELTYNEVFGDITYAFAERMMYKLAEIAFNKVDEVIWDQTNLNPKTRRRKLEVVPKDWLKLAIWFKIPDDLDDRLSSRPGKVIPKKVIDSMKKTFTVPSFGEGFDAIWEANDYLARLKYMEGIK